MKVPIARVQIIVRYQPLTTLETTCQTAATTSAREIAMTTMTAKMIWCVTREVDTTLSQDVMDLDVTTGTIALLRPELFHL